MTHITNTDCEYDPKIRERPHICRCSVCGGEVYRGELIHYIDGKVVCPDCFFDFTFDYFSDRLCLAEELGRDINEA